MGRSRGRRYNQEKKLNLKKVFAVIIAILVICMFILGIKLLISNHQGEKVTNINYFTAFTNNKYGVIDSNGKTIIEPSYAEYIVIPNSKKDIFLCTYDVNYETGEYKTKALNAKNQEILNEYEQIEPIDNWDLNNNISYENNAIKVKKDGKYGIIDVDGKQILSCEYDKIESLKGVENSILLYKDEKIGLCNSKGKIVIEPQYSEIKAIGTDYQLGYIVKNAQNQYGMVDCNNTKVLDTKYLEIKPVTENNIYVIKQENQYQLINKNGDKVISKFFDDIKGFKNGNIIVKNQGKFGVINTTGEEILPIQYEDVDFAFTDTFIIKLNQKYGLTKKNDQMVYDVKYASMKYIPKADFVEASEDGITSDIVGNDMTIKLTGIVSQVNTEKEYFRIRIKDEYKYYNFKYEEKKSFDLLTGNNLFLDKKNGKYGYIDKEGKVIVDYLYEDGTEQNIYGYVSVKKDGKWGALDKDGNIVAPIEYKLEDNRKLTLLEMALRTRY